MRIGVISAYPDEDLDARQLAEAAGRFGEVRILAPTDFGAAVATVTVCGESAHGFDLYLTPRALGELGNPDAQIELYRALGEMGCVVVNEVSALTTAIDKFRSGWLLARAGVPTPPAVLVQSLDEAMRAVEEMGAAVLKPLYGSLGIEVERVSAADRERVAGRLAQRGALYLQKFVPAELDVRALVVGDRVAAAIARRPAPGDFRSNLNLGAAARSFDLDAEAARVCVRAAETLGLDYAGVDLLLGDDGAVVIEVNGTPSFQGVAHETGCDVATAIVEHAVARAKERNHAGEQGGTDDGEGGRAARRRARRSPRWGDHPRSVRARVLRADRPQGRAKSP